MCGTNLNPGPQPRMRFKTANRTQIQVSMPTAQKWTGYRPEPGHGILGQIETSRLSTKENDHEDSSHCRTSLQNRSGRRPALQGRAAGEEGLVSKRYPTSSRTLLPRDVDRRRPFPSPCGLVAALAPGLGRHIFYLNCSSALSPPSPSNLAKERKYRVQKNRVSGEQNEFR